MSPTTYSSREPTVDDVARPASVLIVDDHAVFAEAIASAFEHSHHFERVQWAQTAVAAVALAEEYAPTLAVVDLRMPDVEGTELISALVESSSSPKVLVLSVASDARSIMSAFDAGASGFLGKHESFESVVTACQAILAGDNPISAAAFSRLLPRLVKRGDTELTEQETRVLELVADGLSNDDIGVELSISTNTARNHVSKILRKLSCDNRAEAVAEARRKQLIPPG